MPQPHACAQPLRIEPSFFFIKGPFWRGALFLLNCALSTVLGGGAIVAMVVGKGESSSWWWRVLLWIVPPIAHYVFLKKYVEGKRPHFAEDVVHFSLRKHLSFARPWPEEFPLLPRLVPEAEESVLAMVRRGPGGRMVQLHTTEPLFATHPLLRLVDDDPADQSKK